MTTHVRACLVSSSLVESAWVGPFSRLVEAPLTTPSNARTDVKSVLDKHPGKFQVRTTVIRSLRAGMPIAPPPTPPHWTQQIHTTTTTTGHAERQPHAGACGGRGGGAAAARPGLRLHPLQPLHLARGAKGPSRGWWMYLTGNCSTSPRPLEAPRRPPTSHHRRPTPTPTPHTHIPAQADG